MIAPETAAAIAEEVLYREARRAPFLRPPVVPALFRWRGEWHWGGIQSPVVFEEPAIVLVSKTSRAVEPEIVAAILQRQPRRLRLEVASTIDFVGKMHVLQRVGHRLEAMTDRQMQLAAAVMARTAVVQVFP